jgi:hypothetical protein
MPHTINLPRAVFLAGLLTAFATGCSSDGYSGGSTSVSSSYYYSNGWYNDPYYYGYYPPGAVVVRPPGDIGRPGPPVYPEQPIARPPGATTLPAQTPGGATTLPARPSTNNLGSRPSTSNYSSRSRMPSSRPRMSSTPRATVPRMSRGGGGRRR